MDLNATKTKDLVIDFRRDQPTIPALEVNGRIIKQGEDYKHLGIIINNELFSKRSTEQIHSKFQQRLFFLQKLRKFNVHQSILQAFYNFFIESIIAFNVVGWFGALGNTSLNPLNRIIRISGKVIGASQDPSVTFTKKEGGRRGNK